MENKIKLRLYPERKSDKFFTTVKRMTILPSFQSAVSTRQGLALVLVLPA